MYWYNVCVAIENDKDTVKIIYSFSFECPKGHMNTSFTVWGEVNWLFNVTINDISVIYVTAHRYAAGLKKKLDLQSGSQRYRHFVGILKVLVQAPTRGQPFYTVIPRNRPIKSPFTTRWRYGGDIFDFNFRLPTEVKFYGQLQLIRSVLRASTFSEFKID